MIEYLIVENRRRKVGYSIIKIVGETPACWLIYKIPVPYKIPKTAKIVLERFKDHKSVLRWIQNKENESKVVSKEN